MDTWIEVPDGSDFPVENLPIGVVEIDGRRRVATRVGDSVLPLGDVIDDPVFEAPVANEYLGRGPAVWSQVRQQITDHVTNPANDTDLTSVDEVITCLPVAVGDYVDFYSSIHHATNVGRIFRPDGDPLLPNWRHLPVGYHGRAGTIVVSDTAVPRPVGLTGHEDGVVRGPSARLDFELELGFVVGVGNELGDTVTIEDSDTHVFGVVLVNDWSARDIQAFEYQPLGPFLGKSFATTISPWIVPLEALAPHRVPGPERVPEPDPALVTENNAGLDITVTASLNGTTLCRTTAAHLYWNHAQQYAHMTSNGASTRPGDLFATGTLSGPTTDERGCLLEITEGGTRPIVLDDGDERTWLEDGDTVTLAGWAGGDGAPRIGLGAATGTVVGSTYTRRRR